MNIAIAFTPAGTVTIQTATSPVPGTFAMPPVDAANSDLQITADPATTAYVAFAAGASVGPEMPGTVVVKPGQSALLTAQAALLARTGNPLSGLVPASGRTLASWSAAVAQAAAAATQCTILTSPPGGVVTITRGTASATTTF